MPLQDPVAKFLIILLIILIIPIVSEKIKIPHLLGMIIAGVVIGPFGFKILSGLDHSKNVRLYTRRKGNIDLTNPSLLNAVEQIDVIGKTIAGIFRKR